MNELIKPHDWGLGIMRCLAFFVQVKFNAWDKKHFEFQPHLRLI